MLNVYAIDTFHFALPEGHRFPLAKYRMLRESLIQTGIIPAEAIKIPPGATEQELVRAHDPAYVRRFFQGKLTEKEMRRIGLPWSEAYAERVRRSAGGTLAACRAAVIHGLSVHLSGGTHHAGYDHGEGFCVFNDAVVAARALQQETNVRRVCIIDCDVHQGNGTASITKDDPTIFTFSIHGQKNFPFRKSPSDIDIGLPDGTGDGVYLEMLEEGVMRALALSNPDFVIYLAGADAHEGDKLGRLSVTKTGLEQRDRFVLETILEQRVPTAVIMGGGYGRDLNDTVAVQANTVRICAELFPRFNALTR
jgi:acetoin utilization deacetylase AcuC-like enzyme